MDNQSKQKELDRNLKQEAPIVLLVEGLIEMLCLESRPGRKRPTLTVENESESPNIVAVSSFEYKASTAEEEDSFSEASTEDFSAGSTTGERFQRKDELSLERFHQHDKSKPIAEARKALAVAVNGNSFDLVGD